MRPGTVREGQAGKQPLNRAWEGRPGSPERLAWRGREERWWHRNQVFSRSERTFMHRGKEKVQAMTKDTTEADRPRGRQCQGVYQGAPASAASPPPAALRVPQASSATTPADALGRRARSSTLRMPDWPGGHPRSMLCSWSDLTPPVPQL